jgi:hypothetical protein
MHHHNVMTWDWEPLVSVGPVRFGEAANPLIEKYNLQRPEFDCDTPDWEAYQFSGTDTLINVENSSIISVACHDNFFYKSNDLLGMSLKQIRQILGQEDEIDSMVGTQIPIYYDSLGLILWMKNDVIVSATCHSVIED